jgi:hypothetical protein
MGFSDSLYRSIFLIIMILISLKFYIKKVKQKTNSFYKFFLEKKTVFQIVPVETKGSGDTAAT